MLPVYVEIFRCNKKHSAMLCSLKKKKGGGGCRVLSVSSELQRSLLSRNALLGDVLWRGVVQAWLSKL